MKRYVKKLIVSIVAVGMVAGYATTMRAEAVTFSDVSAAHWGYSTIMRMTGEGLFQGTSKLVNGVGTFMPEKTMSRAEFVAVVLRAVYPEEAERQNVPGKWWSGYYQLALQHGLLYADELDYGAMELPMSRQEMAMVLVRAMEVVRDIPEKLIDEDEIADYDSIGVQYKMFVRKCFSMGVICGVDSEGTFAPGRSLSRAEAAAVLCRFVHEEDRISVFEEDDDRPISGTIISGSENEDDNDNGNTGNSGNASDIDGGSQTPTEPEDPRDELYGDLTLDEALNLDDDTLHDFKEWLEEQGTSFEEWLDDNQESSEIDKDDPFEGKSLDDYTWKDYMRLDPLDAAAFRDKFFGDDDAAFEAWIDRYNEEPELDEETGFGGSTLDDFTFDDYFEMDMVDQAAFCEQFFDGDEDALFDWLDSQIEEPDLDE